MRATRRSASARGRRCTPRSRLGSYRKDQRQKAFRAASSVRMCTREANRRTSSRNGMDSWLRPSIGKRRGSVRRRSGRCDHVAFDDLQSAGVVEFLRRRRLSDRTADRPQGRDCCVGQAQRNVVAGAVGCPRPAEGLSPVATPRRRRRNRPCGPGSAPSRDRSRARSGAGAASSEPPGLLPGGLAEYSY